MNRQPFQLQSPRWDAALSPFWVRMTRRYRRRLRTRDQKLVQVDVVGIEPLRELVASAAGVLITPNHPGHADSFCLYEAADQVGRPFYFMTAWQVFAMADWKARWFYRRYGCFSVEREGSDLRAFKRAVQILSGEPYPLVVFPEGDVYHTNDRVTPFRDGTAAIAVTAAKHSERPIYAVPCAIKYRYVRDPTPELEHVMTELEQRIYWRPRPQLPLAERVYRFAEAAIALKELEHMHATQSGPLPQRVARLMEHVLRTLERAHDLYGSGQTVPERIKSVRRACLEKLDGEDDPNRAAELRAQLDDVFLVVQLFSYPGDYVSERPTLERLAETIDKFEEDVLGLPTARIRGARRAIVRFGEPIDVRAFGRSGSQLRRAAGPLTETLERSVQSLLDGINGSYGEEAG